ncbi:PREDICTED: protein GLUTAMINE DUMPER 3-like [Tarenaya hassleriana]|uniref:protein GLUTAMINE DUMPER 3-like n=1 Tax=Tarenaya hassleriana TaxID=28532 RepID=UPI00053C2740|nr:PREDICTED: protein GLUTAMINE DUMPER 3-like [Tarenaya hassleriana]
MEGREYNPNMNPVTNRTAYAAAHSPWHSPVPYLFGGLAAMLGLIAFALLILACSYWKLSGHIDGGSGENPDGERDVEAGDGGETKKSQTQMPEKFLVIMAGNVKPTYLATPAGNSDRTSRSSSLMDTEKSCTCGEDDDDDDEEEEEEEVSDQVMRWQSTGGNGEPTSVGRR